MEGFNNLDENKLFIGLIEYYLVTNKELEEEEIIFINDVTTTKRELRELKEVLK